VTLLGYKKRIPSGVEEKFEVAAEAGDGGGGGVS